MAAYVIVDWLEISDPTAFQAYAQKARPGLAKFDGKFLAARGASEVLEGSWRPKNVVVIEFPSLAKAKEWYASSDYQDAKAIRASSTKANFVAVEGV